MSASQHLQQSIIAVSNTSGEYLVNKQRRSDCTNNSQKSITEHYDYSGFQNRYLENNYNKSVFAMLFLFQNTLLKFFDGEKCNQESFASILAKLFGRMLTLESQKLGAPKFTKCLSKLVKFLGVKIDEDQIAKHEASINRLLTKQDYHFEYIADQGVNRSMEARPSRSESLGNCKRPSHFKDDQNVLVGSFEDYNVCTSPKRSRKRKQSDNIQTQKSQQPNTRPMNSLSTQKNRKTVETQKKTGFAKGLEDQQHVNRNDDFIQAPAQEVGSLTKSHNSIRTIKEDDHTKEEDEINAEKVELIKSPSQKSPGRRHYQQSKLDVAFSRLNYNSGKIPAQFEVQGDQDYKASPTNQNSPMMHIRSLEYNEKTIKGQAQLDVILDQAKRQYISDKNKHVAQSVDYQDFSALAIAKRKKMHDSSGIVQKKLSFGMKPAQTIIQNLKLKQHRTQEKWRQSGEQQPNLNINIKTSFQMNPNPIAKQPVDPYVQLRSRRFLKQLQRRQRVKKSKSQLDSSDSQSQEEIEALKENITRQYLANQQKIQEKRNMILGISNHQSESKGRIMVKKLLESKMHRTTQNSIEKFQDESIISNDRDRSLQITINRRRDKKENASLDEGLKQRRKLINKSQQRDLLKSNPQIVNGQLQNIGQLVYAINYKDSIQMQSEYSEQRKYDSNIRRRSKLQQLQSQEVSENVPINQDLRLSPEYQQISQSLAYKSLNSFQGNQDQIGAQRQPQQYEQKQNNNQVPNLERENRQHQMTRNQILNLVPLPLDKINRSQEKDAYFAKREFEKENHADAGITASHRKRQKIVARDSTPSSGRWRQPAGVASVGLDQKGNSFSDNLADNEARSQINPNRPAMMMNTLYSNNEEKKRKTIASYETDYYFGKENDQKGVVGIKEQLLNESRMIDQRNIPIQRRRTQIRPNEVGVDEPSQPQFPPSGIGQTSFLQYSPLRWKAVKSAARATRTVQIKNDNDIGDSSGRDYKNGMTGSLPDGRRFSKNHRRTQFSDPVQQNEQDSYPVGAPLIKHYQTRLHTRGEPSSILKNDGQGQRLELGEPQSQMMHTMKNWTRQLQGETVAYAESESNPMVDEGVQKYILTQQDKRKKVQTGQTRKFVNQTQSMHDQREIFSEEDFCNPEYHKFRLPTFSKEHHESLFESQNKRLNEQRQIFEDKANQRSSHSRSINQMMGYEERQRSVLDEIAEAPVVESDKNFIRSPLGDIGFEFQCHRDPFYFPKTDSQTKKMPVQNSQQKFRVAFENIPSRTLNDFPNQILRVTQEFQTQESKADPLLLRDEGEHSMVEDNYVAYENSDEKKKTPKNTTSKLVVPRLSTQVAALINETDGEDDIDELKFKDNPFERDFDEEVHILNQIERRYIEEVKHSVIGSGRGNKERLPDALSSFEQSAPDKEIFELSERKEDDLIEIATRQNASPRVQSSGRLFADSPRQSKQTLIEQHARRPDDRRNMNFNSHEQNNYVDRVLLDKREEASERNRLQNASSHSARSSLRNRFEKLPENVISHVVKLDSKLKLQTQKQTSNLHHRNKEINEYGQQKTQQVANYAVFDVHQEGDKFYRSQKLLVKHKSNSYETTSQMKLQMPKMSCSQDKQTNQMNRNSSHDQQQPQENLQLREVVYSFRKLSGSNRRSIQTKSSVLPKSLNSQRSDSAQRQRLSKLSLQQRRVKKVP